MNESEDILELIALQLNQMPDYGQLQIHLKRHAGKYSNTDLVKMTPHRYTDNEPNVTCTTDILGLIKQIADAGVDGSLGFSITFKKGRADLMQVSDFKKL